MSGSRLILLDRDGTLIVEKDYLSDPGDLELIPGAAEAIRALRELGHKVVLVTNQSGVARGFFSEETVRSLHIRLQELLRAEGTELDGIYYCPHAPGDNCDCRKPQPGMLIQASRDTGLPLDEAVMVGDKPADIGAGKAVGATTVLVLTGYGAETAQQTNLQPDSILPSLSDLIQLL